MDSVFNNSVGLLSTISSVIVRLLDARFLLVSLIAVLSARYIITRLRLKNLPPGPWGIPVLGASLLVGKNPGRSLLKLSEKYGRIFSLRLGQNLTVVISDAELAREVFIKNAHTTSGRVRSQLGSHKQSVGSLVLGDGPEQKYLRRVILRSLRDVGIGKTRVAEKLISEEADILCRTMEENNQCAFDPKQLVFAAVGNIISTLCFSERFDYDDPKYLHIIACVQMIHSVESQTDTGTYLAMFLKAAQIACQSMKSIKVLIETVSKITEQHKLDYDVNDVRDVIDVLLEELKKPGGMCQGAIDDNSIWRTVLELFSAGTDTTANTLNWSIIYMATNRDVQNNVKREISDLMGFDRRPCLSDRNELPYTNAAITEVLRIAHPVPLGLAHRTTAPMQLGGYDIPEDTVILNPQWAMSRDGNTWENPEAFDPTRFLSADGKTFKVPSGGFIPFGIGPRACLGEMLASIELFLFFAFMMQRFTFEVPPGEPQPSHEGNTGIMYTSQNYRVRAVPNVG